jgi:hypothetical protein
LFNLLSTLLHDDPLRTSLTTQKDLTLADAALAMLCFNTNKKFADSRWRGHMLLSVPAGCVVQKTASNATAHIRRQYSVCSLPERPPAMEVAAAMVATVIDPEKERVAQSARARMPPARMPPAAPPPTEAPPPPTGPTRPQG